MPPQPQTPLWHNNTYLILSLCALRLFTPLCSREIARLLSANFTHAALHTHDVRRIWETVTAERPPWFEHMASLWPGDAQVAGVVNMLMGRELEGNVPLDGEEGEGEWGWRRAVDVMVGRTEGIW